VAVAMVVAAVVMVIAAVVMVMIAVAVAFESTRQHAPALHSRPLL
jgi:lipopolysaccharide/colanic/teichoic acid biosynthesis glycosyltransferase